MQPKGSQFQQLSVFGDSDRAAGVIGASTESNHEAVMSQLERTTAVDASLRDDVKSVVGRMPRQDQLALLHRPPKSIRDDSGVSGDALGEYLPDTGRVKIGVDAHTWWSGNDVDYTVAHELGHHLHVKNSLSHRLQFGDGTGAHPMLEGVADGFADRVTGPRPSGYERVFNSPNARMSDLAGRGPKHGPMRETMEYTRSRKEAREGGWPDAGAYKPPSSVEKQYVIGEQQRMF